MSKSTTTITGRALDLMQRHPLATLAVTVILLLGGIYFGAGALAALQHWRQNKAVDKLEQKADASEEKSRAQVNQAEKEKLDRFAEDQIRDRTITPNLEPAARAVDTARRKTETAKAEYDKARNARPNYDPDTRALHDRNCSDLRELYPGEDLEFCRP